MGILSGLHPHSYLTTARYAPPQLPGDSQVGLAHYKGGCLPHPLSLSPSLYSLSLHLSPSLPVRPCEHSESAVFLVLSQEQRAPRKHWPTLTNLDLSLPSSDTVRKYVWVVEATQSMVFCYNHPNRLRHAVEHIQLVWSRLLPTGLEEDGLE